MKEKKARMERNEIRRMESKKKLCKERYRIILQYKTIYTVNIVGKITAKAVIRTRWFKYDRDKL
jgi:hypothetical protein